MSNESLWEFALATYASPGVESLCLALQEREGININILLWGLWLDHQGLVVDEKLWHRAIDTIAVNHHRVVRVRCLRRALPKWVGLLWLRDRIQAWELRLEKVELLKLQQLTESHSFMPLSESGQSDGNLRRSLKAVVDREYWLQQFQSNLGKQ